MKYLHTNIVAKDWKKLSAFYQKVFGCKPLDPPRNYPGGWIEEVVGVEGAHVEGEHIELPGYGEDGPTLEIFSYSTPAEQGPLNVYDYGFAHICFEVDDVAEVLKKIMDEGGSVQSTFSNPMEQRCVYAKDPEGNIIEIHLPSVKKLTYRFQD